jgi:hypothetical protein
LTEREDELLWDGDLGGVYTPKVGYVQLNIDLLQQDEKWWWRKIWKQRCPAKGKILAWTILENKIPTWENLQKRQFNGPSWCSLCKEQGESVDHLFMRCPFTTSVWAEATKLNSAIGAWQGASFEEALMVWLSPRTPQDLKYFPLIVAWGIWLARNSTLFRDEPQSPLRVAINCLGILAHLKPVVRKGLGNARGVQVEQIDRGRPWDFFDGAASGDHLLCGGEGGGGGGGGDVYTYLHIIFSSQGWVGGWYKQLL